MYLDIEKIRKEITMAHILSYYGIQLREINQNRLTGCCPIHHGDNPNAFHVDLNKNIFNCFTHCGGGSIFDFVMKKENLSFHTAAMKIWETFYPYQSQPQLQKQRIIRPLKLQPNHPYLRKRNISQQWARYFQMGFCQYGIMKNRIAIPILDREKQIVAYCGRAIQDNCPPKYLFPKNFNKSHYLFNIHRIKPHDKRPIFLVEGFFGCIHIVKSGFDAIALMGTSISYKQLKIMKDINRFFILMLDGDDAGRKATPKVEKKMNLYNIPFKTVHLIDVKEPELFDYDCLRITAQIQ